MLGFWRKTAGWKLPIIGLIALVFALTSVFGRKTSPSAKPAITPPVTPYAQTIAGIGVIEPCSELIAIGTELSGIVRDIHVTVGQVVEKDAPLFSLDQRDIDAQIATLEATLKSAKVQAEDAQAQFNLVKDIQDKRAIAKDDYDRRKYAAKLSQSRLLEIKAQLMQAKTTKKRLKIASPIKGTILDINIRPGEFATAGALAEPLLRMGDISTLHVRVEFDEENAKRLPKNAPAKAYQRANPSPYPLKFIRLEPYVTPKQNLAVAGQRVDTRVLQAIYALPKDTSLLPGQQMDVFVKDHQP